MAGGCGGKPVQPGRRLRQRGLVAGSGHIQQRPARVRPQRFRAGEGGRVGVQPLLSLQQQVLNLGGKVVALVALPGDQRDGAVGLQHKRLDLRIAAEPLVVGQHLGGQPPLAALHRILRVEDQLAEQDHPFDVVRHVLLGEDLRQHGVAGVQRQIGDAGLAVHDQRQHADGRRHQQGAADDQQPPQRKRAACLPAPSQGREDRGAGGGPRPGGVR